ncbi:hypothetical protein ACWCXX_00370 [Streptomyces sp. NPDC001732]
MAIFKHLIPARHRDEKRDMTSGHGDHSERDRHRRHRNTRHGRY